MKERLLDKRQARILEFVIRDYIKAGDPVSSAYIRESLELRESPATIRNIVAQLGDIGYLEQPHTSAGRIPTDQAYRYFINHLMISTTLRPAEVRHLEEALSKELETINRFFSDTLRLLSITRTQDEDILDQYGISHLLKEPEFHKKEAIDGIGYLLDHSREMMEQYDHAVRDDYQVFIGKENPMDQASTCGVFYLSCVINDQKRRMLLVGPRRMNYERASAFIRYFFERI